MNEIALYKALIEAGASEEQAQAAVDDLPRTQDVATKADLAHLETRIAQVDARMSDLKAEMIKWMVGLWLAGIAVVVAVLLGQP